MSTPFEELDGLKRKLTITIADDRISNKLDQRLKDLTGQVQLKGFRPGKVPFKEVKRRFGKQIRLEIIDSLIGDTFSEAVDEHKLKIAGAPDIEPVSLDEGQPVTYTAEFEIVPEFELASLNGTKLEKITVNITDEDLNNMIDKMRKQHAEWNDVDRAVKDGDKVVVDFDGTIDGESLEGGKAENYELEIGSNSMISGFEEGLVGAKPGDELTLNLSFPEDYHHKEIAGKPVNFAIKVHKVREGVLPEIDEHFTKKLKIKDGPESLNDEVRENMRKEADSRSKQMLKSELCDVLISKYDFAIPESMVKFEAEQIKKNFAQRVGLPEDQQLSDEDLPFDVAKQSNDNVTLGLIFSKVVESNELEVSDEKLNEKLAELAAPFSNPEQIMQIYRSNEKMLEDVKAQAMEDLVVEHLMQDVELSEKSLSFKEFDEHSQKKD